MQRPPDPQLLGFLEAYDCHISDLALALREVILEEAPDASESIYQVYTVAIWFGFSGKMKDMFCYIATNAKHVNLGFPSGAALPDPNRVLEGEGKRMRHIKFASERDLERPFVRRYIQAAIEQIGVPAGGGVRFQLSLWQGGLPVDAIPHQGWLELRTTNPAELVG